jgi:hypothetical protein
VIIEAAIDNEFSMINEVNLYENDYQISDKIYTELLEQKTELMIGRLGWCLEFCLWIGGVGRVEIRE